MATKPTPEQAAIRILWLMVQKYGLRENGMAHQGQFLAAFPQGAFHSEDFKPGAEYAISKGWVEPARMGSLPALRLKAAGFAAAPERDFEMDTSESRALRLLEAIYDRTRDSGSPVFAAELAPSLGISEEEARSAWRYLSDKHLIDTFNLLYTARVNANGKDAVEHARQHPTQPTPGFGSVTYNTINVHHMESSSIQQAGEQSSLVQTVNYNAKELDDLRRALDLLQQHFDELRLEPAAKNKALAQVATLNAQLSDEPDPVILKQAARTLRSLVEGVIAGLVTEAIKPEVWQFIGSVLGRFG
jgi:hypothetical protein